MKSFKFVDLFAGLGGFHYALKDLGGECVFVSEIDNNLRDLYHKNHKVSKSIIYGDISECWTQVPDHDILVAGFPCQPFSKSGKQLGFNDKKRGNCIFYVLNILKKVHPKYFIFENVPNFAKHNNGESWREVKKALTEMGYCVRSTSDAVDEGKSANHLSPNQYGFPQKRDRFFAIGSKNFLPKNPFPISNEVKPKLKSILLTNKDKKRKRDKLIDLENCNIIEQGVKAINLWNKFIDCLPNKHKDLMTTTPLWLEEIDAEYPYVSQTPYQNFLDRGFSIEDIEKNLNLLPPYAREKVSRFPLWKVKFIDSNREWLSQIKKYIDPNVIQDIRKLDYTYRKFEWNCKFSTSSNIWDHTIQMRPSGVRVSYPSYIPTVVSINANQTPIYGPLGRHLTKRELARAFGFPDKMKLLENSNAGFTALGNAVHVEVAKLVAKNLLNYGNNFGNNVSELQNIDDTFDILSA